MANNTVRSLSTMGLGQGAGDGGLVVAIHLKVQMAVTETLFVYSKTTIDFNKLPTVRHAADKLLCHGLSPSIICSLIRALSHPLTDLHTRMMR